jgi:hypothetical protein
LGLICGLEVADWPSVLDFLFKTTSGPAEAWSQEVRFWSTPGYKNPAISSHILVEGLAPSCLDLWILNCAQTNNVTVTLSKADFN